jgi:hypothetical protein
MPAISRRSARLPKLPAAKAAEVDNQPMLHAGTVPD